MMHTTTGNTVQPAAEHVVHEHAWVLESAHNTSEGRVLYVRCARECGARRIDLQGVRDIAPSAASIVVPSRQSVPEGARAVECWPSENP